MSYRDYTTTTGDVSCTSTVRVLPRANWRGQYEGGVFSGGWPACTGSNGPNCITIDWPAPLMHTYLDGQRRPQGDWMGSLVQDQRDASGLLFRRNRYYDPATGQFTQQDPIGIAGGSNLYGFANGDPINFSDPFGLCVPFPICTAAIGAATGGAGGAVIRMVSNALEGRSLGDGVASAAIEGAAWGAVIGGIGAFAGGGVAAGASGFGQWGDEAFAAAQTGGRHAGFLRNYATRSSGEINRASRSLARRIADHEAKLANPAAFVDDWGSLSSARQSRLMNHWRDEIRGFAEQIEILGRIGG
ncbi:RHS repeat-associated core domain-containing protein [Gaopeijia maritima]|uniref:RHS repeat-associated core domain-containing protein n=1 Tax=Gaopeijia maritima TaxID=3119007 RepID=UPI00324D54BB